MAVFLEAFDPGATTGRGLRVGAFSASIFTLAREAAIAFSILLLNLLARDFLTVTFGVGDTFMGLVAVALVAMALAVVAFFAVALEAGGTRQLSAIALSSGDLAARIVANLGAIRSSGAGVGPAGTATLPVATLTAFGADGSSGYNNS